MSRIKYTDEMIKFLSDGFKQWRVPELTERFNGRFGENKTPQQIKAALSNHKITSGRPTGLLPGERKLKYTDEQIAWIKEAYKRLTIRELTAELNAKFGLNEDVTQVRAFVKNHKITSGRNGRFARGNKAWNKGKKGINTGGEAGWFKKGVVPPNVNPIGHERICAKDGYIYIKVEERNPYNGYATRYRAKHHVEWEKVNGPVPKGMALIFKDGDKTNCNISNLMLVDRGQLAVMNKTGLIKAPAVAKETAALTASLIMATRKAQEKAIND